MTIWTYLWGFGSIFAPLALNIHESYMHRCLSLAKLGAGMVAPNPMVGAVLVCEDRIIGEGYHHQYGQPHAEVNCLASVKEEYKKDIPRASLYVSLEPCAHYGKTPPCADLIISQKIPKVYIGCQDPFTAVNGKGIEKLKRAGIEVELGVLEKECLDLNRRFFHFHLRHRPYIILKWAQSSDGFMAGAEEGRLFISNPFSNRLVHKWRSEEAGILVGTRTVWKDNPALTNRLWNGPSPVRLIIDLDLRVPKTHQVFDKRVRTILFNLHESSQSGNLEYYQIASRENLVPQIMNALFSLGIQSVLVEGGATLLNGFLDAGMWDEARVIVNRELKVRDGLKAPVLRNEFLVSSENDFSDSIYYYKNLNP